ncbi:meiotic recombination protein DMC1 homolog isoform X2 [Papaver somniferum]|uniref:meiotic recombination protein DMC1 homolog isoform X2 n=1 Tax=Papaver somniferum TaxID=3469 RepID=UPI000E6FE611|nr:meiotic recombination protein DMC1 homolog isoform X2 [Papaver somniferum]
MKIFFLKSDGNGQLQLIERDDMEDEGCSFEAIEKLIAQGINAGDIKKLQDAGLCNWNQFMMRAKKDFTGVKGLSEDKVDKIFDSVCEAAEKLAKEEIVKITSGSSVLDEHLVIAQGINAGDIKKLQDAGVHTVPETAENIVKKEIVKLTSGSSALDELLGGNAKPSCVTEAVGEFRSGQTQLAHTHCVPKQIFVKTLAGKTLCFRVKTDDTVSDLKRKIEEKETFPIQQQKFIFAGKELRDSFNIDKFYNEATIYLTSGLCGGSRRRGKDISKGQRNIFKANDKQTNEDTSTARMQRQGPRLCCIQICISKPRSDFKRRQRNEPRRRKRLKN